MEEIPLHNSSKKIKDFYSRNSVRIYLLFLTLFVFGIISLFYLDFDLVPDIRYPELWVATTYPNATPSEVKNLVTIPVEESCISLKGVRGIESISRDSLSLVKLIYRWGHDMDTARIELRERLDILKSFFPREVERPIITGYQTSGEAVIGISVLSPLMDDRKLYLFCQNNIAPELEKADGVARVSIQGGEPPRVKVLLSPEKLIKYKLGIENIIKRIGSFHKDFPVGSFNDDRYEYVVRVKADLDNYKNLGNVVLKNGEKKAVHLSDVAMIEYGSDKKKGDVLINGSEALLLTVYKRPTANMIEVSKQVDKKMALLARRYGSDILLEKVFDHSTFIRNSLKELSFAMLFGILCTVLAVYLFIADLKMSLIIVFTIPVCIVSTFIIMKVQNISINLLTLGGFVLALGMIVDNSVIVATSLLNSIYEAKTHEKFYFQIRRIIPAVLSTTFTTIVVFFPVFFLEGILKVLFLQLSVVIVVCLIFSLLVSITLIPLLLYPRKRIKSPAVIIIQIGDFIEKAYYKTLYLVMRKKIFFSLILTLLIAAGIYSYNPLKKRFMESIPQDYFYLYLFVNKPVSLAYTLRFLEKVTEIITRENRVSKIIAFIGREKAKGGYGDLVLGQNSAVLKIYSHQKGEGIYGLINSLREELGVFGDVDFVFTIPNNPVQKLISRSDFEVRVNIYNESAEFLAEKVNNLHHFLEQNGLATDILSSLYFSESEQAFSLKRENISFLGVETTSLSEYLRTALGGIKVGEWTKDEDDIPIFLHFQEKSFNNVEEILNLQIKNRYGNFIKLDDILNVEQIKSPNFIMRNNQQTFARVEFNLNREPRVFPFFHNVKSKREIIEKYLISEGLEFEYQDEFALLRKNFPQLILALVLAVFLEYMILASLFKSFSKPFIIILMIPASLPGIFLILYLIGSSLNLNTFMSMIVLVGLMVNNAIMLFLEYEDEKVRDKSGVVRASVKRIKPILVTTFSTILAVVPTLFTGNKIQTSISLTLVAGLLYSATVTVFYLPVFYHMIYVRKE